MTVRKTRVFGLLALIVLLSGAMTTLNAANKPAFVITSTNAATNQLLVYTPSGQLLQTLATHGKGGVSGNAGGIAVDRNLLAVVNFGSSNVSIFQRHDDRYSFIEVVPAQSAPVSVAFGRDHLYILGVTTVESHPVWPDNVGDSPDGVATLLKGDGSAAQVGVLPGQLIVSEKSNTIETVGLEDGAVNGAATLVSNIPANVNAPFGLITRGNDAYVTIAHANEISLVRKDAVLTVTGSGTQMAPCWLALDGPFLYSSNSPSKTVSRYAVYGQQIVQDAAIAASFTGNPTDIDIRGGLVAVVDATTTTTNNVTSTVSRLSVFSEDEDGNLTNLSVSTINSAANGVAVISDEPSPVAINY